MQPDRRQPDDRVAGPHALPVGQGSDVNDADDRPGQIEITRFVEPGHLGGFAAEQRHRVGFAGPMAARDDLGRDRRIEPSDR